MKRNGTNNQPAEQTSATLPTKQHKSKAAKNTPIDKIRKQLRKNPLLTQQELADKNSISKQAVNQLLKRHGLKTADIEEYKNTRAELFAGKQEMVLRAIDQGAVKRMLDKAPMAAVNLFGVLFDKERLERGQSTSNQHILLNAIMATEDE